MGKLISAAVAGIVGALLAGTAVWGVVAANTAAPKHNPASAPIVNYGNR
ncbi:MAG: hypothetical protein QOI26_1187 [Pseudonocardiales bacterium]|nr:hypothetical protein [Pseudonocardiales bacterium]